MNNPENDYVKINMTSVDESKNEYLPEYVINNNNNSYCLYTPTKNNTNLYYKNGSLIIIEGQISFAYI